MKTTIDPATVRFGSPAEITNGGGATVAHGGGHVEDVDGDGSNDWLAHFPTPDTGFEGDETEGWLVGRTVDGRSIAGRDSVRIVGCGDVGKGNGNGSNGKGNGNGPNGKGNGKK